MRTNCHRHFCLSSISVLSKYGYRSWLFVLRALRCTAEPTLCLRSFGLITLLFLAKYCSIFSNIFLSNLVAFFEALSPVCLIEKETFQKCCAWVVSTPFIRANNNFRILHPYGEINSILVEGIHIF